MRILITGGTGLIGRRLCQVLLAENHELTVFSRNPASVPIKCGAGVHAIGSLDEWQPQQHFDAVINLAGEPILDVAWSEERKHILRDSRITLTGELVRHIAAAEQKPAVLLSGSAIGYYGNRGDDRLDENEPAGGNFPARLCVEWEQAARRAEELGVRVCILRTGLIMSNGGGMLEYMLPPFRLGMGARMGDGRQWISWVHIEDYVAMLLRLLYDEQACGPYNLTAPHPVTNAEFTAVLSEVLHRPASLVVPSTVLKLGMGERACLLLEGQRVLPKKMEQAQFQFRFSSLSEALRDLLG